MDGTRSTRSTAWRSGIVALAVIAVVALLGAPGAAGAADTVGGREDAAKTRQAGELGQEIVARDIPSKSRNANAGRALLDGPARQEESTVLEVVRNFLPLVLFFAVALLLIKPLGLKLVAPGDKR